MSASISETPTDEQVLDAIDVLKRAGLNITVTPDKPMSSTESGFRDDETAQLRPKTVSEPEQRINPADYINPEYQTINMMLGNGNNNNNDPMMNMLPYMLQQNSDGKNIDPQIIQTLMMNSMMNGISGLNSTENK